MSADAAAAPPPAPRSKADQNKGDMKWITVLFFFLVLSLSGLVFAEWQQPTAGTEEMAGLTDTIFSTGNHTHDQGVRAEALRADRNADVTPGLLVPFEILSALLLAALVAGIVIALRERDGDR